jgi:S1-C subfamily serine protease
VVTEIAGQPASDPESALLGLAKLLPGGPVPIAFIRLRQLHRTELRNATRAPTAGQRGGSEMTLENVRGVGTRVLELEEGSPLDVAGLAANDVIVRMNDVTAPTAAQLASTLRAEPSEAVLLLVVRRGSGQFVTAVQGKTSDLVAR